MLLDYSKKNIAILALAQAAIVLLGIAACGTAGRLCREAGWAVPTFTYLVAHWGWVGLIIPIAWSVLAVWFFHWSKRPVLAEAVIPISGLVIAVFLAFLVLNAFAAGVISTTSPQ
ncbi:MAG TPA: hypothetical protein VMY69_08670 [Phycisphaerae bacterium]|nr:hypothetical protein [Phycisphaerae bacterium]